MQCTLSILSPQLLSSHPFPDVFKIAPFFASPFPKEYSVCFPASPKTEARAHVWTVYWKSQY